MKDIDNDYILGSDVMTWYEARKYCIDIGGNLAKIESIQDHENAINVCKNMSSCWIGLYYSNNNCSWKWTNKYELNKYGFNFYGEPTFSINPWYKNQPNDYNKNCIIISDYYSWNWTHVSCNTSLHYPLCILASPEWTVPWWFFELVLVILFSVLYFYV